MPDPETTRLRMWRRLVDLIPGGGFYDVGRASLCIHDNGVLVAWDRVIKWEWRA